MKQILTALFISLLLAGLFAACSNDAASSSISQPPQIEARTQPERSAFAAGQSEPSENASLSSSMKAGEITPQEQEDDVQTILVTVGGKAFSATPEKNRASDAFVKLLKQEPVTLQMSDYAGFEKVGSLGSSLPADNKQMTTRSGDIVLYNSSQIVVFYGSNAWSYTLLARIDDLSGWESALGNGDVAVTFSIESTT